MDNWFKDWFKSEFYLDVYGHRDDEDAARLISLIVDRLNLAPGANILDAACGAGRHSLILSRLGFAVTGFDLSLPLLQIASRKMNEQGLKLDLVNADIRNVFFRGYFDLIVNLFTSFGYFETDDENFAFARNASEFLKEGGFFALDYFNGKKLSGDLIPFSDRMIGDLKIMEERSYEKGRITKRITLIKNGEKHMYRESVKVYEPDEILKGFGRHGLKMIEIFGDYNGGSFDLSKSDRMIILFVK